MLRRRKPISDAVTQEDALAAVKRAAFKLLGLREHTALELHHKLARRGFAAPVIAAVLTDLRTADHLSEERFAEVYAHSRADKGYGPLRIGLELRERGVSEDIVTNVLHQFADCWGPMLAALQRKKFGAAVPRDTTSQARQLRFLRQRGFTLEQIKALFKDS
jgi:regulatory protein